MIKFERSKDRWGDPVYTAVLIKYMPQWGDDSMDKQKRGKARKGSK